MAEKEKRLSWWQKVFKKPQSTIPHYWDDVLSGIVPLYTSSFGEDIYASDVVQQAIHSIVSELKKLDPVHIRKIGNDLIEVAGDIQNVLDAPNPLMTTTDFIEKISWNLLLNYNSFIYPLWDEHNDKKLVALYPLQPTEVEFDTDYQGTGVPYIRMLFPNGSITEMPYEDIIHLRYRFSASEFMGGNKNGKPDFKPLLDTLKLNDTLLKGLAKSLNLQTSINGVLKLRNMVDFDKKLLKIKDFEKLLAANSSGFLATDIIEEFTPITKQIRLLDATTLEFIDRKILRNWGVSIPFVNGDYTKDQYEATYQKVVEPIVKTLNQAFTKGIFTKRRAQGFNNRIEFYVKELIFMNTDQKLNLFKDLSAQGGVYVNEYRQAFGMRPLNDLQGVRMQSLNWVSAEYAKEYQTGNKGGTKAEDQKENDKPKTEESEVDINDE